jgi:hypothetical protein
MHPQQICTFSSKIYSYYSIYLECLCLWQHCIIKSKLIFLSKLLKCSAFCVILFERQKSKLRLNGLIFCVKSWNWTPNFKTVLFRAKSALFSDLSTAWELSRTIQFLKKNISLTTFYFDAPQVLSHNI